MKESDLWKYIRDGLKPYKCHLTRIESSAGNGVPDVSIGLPAKNVWAELKYVREWPKRPTTKLKLPLRPEQKHWINIRGYLSGDVWVICRVENTFFLIPSNSAVLLAENGACRCEWDNYATLVFDDRIDFNKLYAELCYGY